MQHRVMLLMTLAVGGLLAGCMPNATTYFHPSVTNGQVEVSGHCVPLPTDVVFQVGPLPARARVQRVYRDTYIDVRMGSPTVVPPPTHPGWRSFHFTADRFVVRDLIRKVDIVVDGLTYQDHTQSVTVPATAPYWLEVRLPDPVPARFELISPSIVIDGQEYPFPPIGFKRTLWAGISPFNC